MNVKNSRGVRLLQTQVYRTQTAFDLGALTAALYILRMLTGDGPAITRILITR